MALAARLLRGETRGPFPARPIRGETRGRVTRARGSRHPARALALAFGARGSRHPARALAFRVAWFRSPSRSPGTWLQRASNGGNEGSTAARPLGGNAGSSHVPVFSLLAVAWFRWAAAWVPHLGSARFSALGLPPCAAFCSAASATRPRGPGRSGRWPPRAPAPAAQQARGLRLTSVRRGVVVSMPIKMMMAFAGAHGASPVSSLNEGAMKVHLQQFAAGGPTASCFGALFALH